MEKENIRTIGIKDFKQATHVLDYVDDDFVIVNSLEGTPSGEYSVRLDCFLIAVCLEGCLQIDINFKTYQISKGDLLLGLPNTILSNTLLSPQHKIRLVGFSTGFLQRVIKIGKDSWETAIHIHKNPIIHSSSNDNSRDIFHFYRELIMAKINDEPHYYHKEVIRHLFSALFCEMMGYLNKEVPESEKEDVHNVNYSQSSVILRKFITLLAQDEGVHRTVSYYAQALCYTPKHLSKVIKQACGRNPLSLINDTAMEHIKYRLKHSDKSIKEISEEFNFPNQSFFGKYFKAHIGISPANYRNSQDSFCTSSCVSSKIDSNETSF